MTSDISPEAVERLAEDMQKHMPWGRGANTLRALSTALTEARAENERLREVLEHLDKAASEVARRGAETGPQWSKLTIASLKARAALQEKPHD